MTLILLAKDLVEVCDIGADLLPGIFAINCKPLFDFEAAMVVGSVNLTMDIRNAIHGLEVGHIRIKKNRASARFFLSYHFSLVFNHPKIECIEYQFHVDGWCKQADDDQHHLLRSPCPIRIARHYKYRLRAHQGGC
ncbi:MAG: hypothetical protein Ct9H300mP4_04840 [Gammaproteobacteria bacterium]|nr:MAG: hypothetical protein Ct9H300mP4_04840 [Gammaproteobacteria bacterium]